VTIDLDQAWEIVKSGGVAGVLFLLVVAGWIALYREWIVTGPTFRFEITRGDREAERADKWEQIALRGTGLLEEQTEITKASASQSRRAAGRNP